MDKIESKEELKELILPVLKYRKRLLNKNNIKMDEDEIFTYFINARWKNANNLHLCDIVDDVLNLDIDERCDKNETI